MERICPNCQHELEEKHKYCPNCGQKQEQKLIPSLREFIAQSLDSVFNLDSKIFATLQALFVPAKLTQNYFRGIRQRYYPPFRIFFVSALLFLAVVNLMSSRDQNVLKSNVPALIKDTEKNVLMWNTLDSLSKLIQTKQNGNNLALQKTIDVLKSEIPDSRKDSIDVYVKVSQRDLVSFSPIELADRYGIHSFWERLFFIQMAKLIKSPQKFNTYLMNHMMWLIIFSMPILAFILKVQYRKSRKYYMEHLVFLLHYTAFVLFSSAIVLFLESILNTQGFYWALFVFQFLFLLFAMKTYYGQSWGKTFFKWTMFNFFGLFVFAFAFTFFALLSFTLFS